ncbi:ABC transporter ATP-binding protein [Convivina intestini]|uniref:ABC transporter ATP-binding protein n=1 Tax=Convivina intestini TaxID=1505726 RepID=UPI0020100CB6|nr:ABC transporter ATP-binding protein [Convivina intestini]CAH1853264.1 Bacitracin export ATP-binding protein BceA [Convivina intestini]
MTLLELQHIQKSYQEGLKSKVALKDISFGIESGEYVAIMGESGAGKTTLLNIMATLDKPTSGKIELNGTDLKSLSENEAAHFRRKELGFIFQNFDLLDTFNNRDNIFLPLVLSKVPEKEMQAHLTGLAEQLEITDLLDRYPSEISGGQKQRVAAARALITQPELILADEPTGALDSHSSAQLLELFDQVNQAGQTILMVTHSALTASYSKRTLFIKDGIIYHQLNRGELSQKEYLDKISASLNSIINGGSVN